MAAVIVGLIAGCAEAAVGSRPTEPSEADSCPAPYDSLHCGRVAVAGDALEFAVSQQPGANRHLFFLPGGPGLSGIADSEAILARIPAAIQKAYQVVLIEPPAANVALACPDAERRHVAARWNAGTTSAVLDAATEFAPACKAEAGTPLDATVYDSPTLADLLDAARVQRGAETITLLAESYGTLAAIDYAVRYPERVDRVVLDAPAATTDVAAAEMGPAVTAAIDRWQQRCAATGCVPGIDATGGGLYRRVLAALADTPGSVMLDAGPIPVRARDLEYLAMTVQLQPTARPAFLDLLVRADAGDPGPLGRAIADLHRLDPASLQPVFDPSPPALGGYVAGRCADSGWRTWSSAERRAAYESATNGGRVAAHGVLMAEAPCIGFPQAQEPMARADPGAVAAPLLVVHSPDDGLTSPSVLASLLAAEDVVELVVDGGGHSSLRAEGCVANVVSDFLLGAAATSWTTTCDAP